MALFFTHQTLIDHFMVKYWLEISRTHTVNQVYTNGYSLLRKTKTSDKRPFLKTIFLISSLSIPASPRHFCTPAFCWLTDKQLNMTLGGFKTVFWGWRVYVAEWKLTLSSARVWKEIERNNLEQNHYIFIQSL